MELASSLPSTMLNQLIQDVPNGIGIIKFALNALKIGPSMLIKSVLLSLIFVLLMMQMELVPLASLVMTLSMEFVNFLHSIMLNPLTLDVLNGTGTIKSVSNAPKNGYSMLMESVSLSVINALLMMPTELVSLVIKDTTLSMEFVSSLPLTMLNLQIMAALNGTGTTKFVLNAQKIGSRMLMELVSLFLINVLLMMLQVLASHASRDMTLSMEFVSSHHSTTLSLQIQDVQLGTGTIKFVSHVQRTGLKMLMESVFLLVTNALSMMLQELAQLVSVDMILSMEFVNSLLSTTLSLQIQDALNGIGTTKFVLNVLKNGSSMLTVSVLQYLINVLLTMRMVLVYLAIKDMT